MLHRLHTTQVIARQLCHLASALATVPLPSYPVPSHANPSHPIAPRPIPPTHPPTTTLPHPIKSPGLSLHCPGLPVSCRRRRGEACARNRPDALYAPASISTAAYVLYIQHTRTHTSSVGTPACPARYHILLLHHYAGHGGRVNVPARRPLCLARRARSYFINTIRAAHTHACNTCVCVHNSPARASWVPPSPSPSLSLPRKDLLCSEVVADLCCSHVSPRPPPATAAGKPWCEFP